MPMRDQVAPVFASGVVERRMDDLEIFRIVRVRADEQTVAVRFDIVAEFRRSCGHQLRGLLDVLEVREPGFAGIVVAHGHDRIASRPAAPQMHEPAGIEILRHQFVRALIGAEPVPEDLRRPVVVVDPDIEKGAGIPGPDDGPVRALDDVVQVFAAIEIADPDRVEFRTLFVATPRQQAVARGMFRSAEIEKGLALRQRIAVEEQYIVAAIAGATTDQFVLPAFAEPDEILECAVGPRNLRIVFLDAPPQLGDQLRLERAGGRQDRIRIRVLRIEVRTDFGRRLRRIGENLLPVGRAEPGVFVDQVSSVDFGICRPTQGRRRPARVRGFVGRHARASRFPARNTANPLAQIRRRGDCSRRGRAPATHRSPDGANALLKGGKPEVRRLFKIARFLGGNEI